MSSLENFLLVGLLEEIDNTLTPQTIDPTRIINESKKYATEKWISKHFRTALQSYCDICEKIGVRLGAQWVKQYAPIFAASAGLTIGPAVAFLCAALGVLLSEWCKTYGMKEFVGQGDYDPYAYFIKSGNKIKGQFFVIYKPAIAETIKDTTSGGLPTFHIDVKVPEEIIGFFDPENTNDVDTIYKNYEKYSRKIDQKFQFIDQSTNKLVKGLIGKDDGHIEIIPAKNQKNLSVTNTNVILQLKVTSLTF